MTARFAWVSMLVAGGTALLDMLGALAFLPTGTWERFVPIATVLGGAGVLAAAAAAAWAGEGLARPLRRIVQAVEADEIGQDSLHRFAGEAPAEVSALLHGLHHAQARLHRTLDEMERDRAQMSMIFQHMADGVLVLDPYERIELGNPAAAQLLHVSGLVGRPLAEVVRDADLVEVARAARASRSRM